MLYPDGEPRRAFQEPSAGPPRMGAAFSAPVSPLYRRRGALVRAGPFWKTSCVPRPSALPHCHFRCCTALL